MNKQGGEKDVYLSGKTVRYILKRFKDNDAIGLQGFRVKASVPIVEEIKEIVEKHKDPTFGTYDYDGIAVEVIKLVTK
jgi:hypothetical protein